MENIFKICAYGRTELAQRYFPDMTAKAAWKKLKSWIEGCHGLTKRLGELEYDGRKRWFTPSQVKAIIEYLDEP